MNVWNCVINQDNQLISTPSSATEVTADRAVALGYFDGVHLGHQKIFSTMREKAAELGLRTAVQTFDNPPASKSQNSLITTYPERCGIVSAWGVDDLFALPFNERVKGMSAADFLNVCVKGWMHARVVVVGQDYRFGRGRAGDVTLLRDWGKKNGIEVVAVEPELFEGRRISSTWVRELIEDGDVEKVETLLDHPLAYTGFVEKGQQLGRKLGFPTANIRIEKQKMIPKFGVYASAYLYDGKLYHGLTNVGMRPTVNKDDDTPLTETMIFNEHFQLYGTRGTVFLLRFIRPEKHFGSIDELKEQMKKDQKEVWQYHTKRQKTVRFEGYM
ncbi:MAG: bifunctional riboflavin kinase/FAD synthetase [Clostridiales bacterium]|nr:bifunctional riboflavin kinase/FAD synthetase [Clostridiales bacterium]